jgi:Tol biopolymer transport system component
VGPSTVAIRQATETSLTTVPPKLNQALATIGAAVIVEEDRILVSDDAGHFRPLASGPPDGYLKEPAWRPDGKQIAYTRVVPIPITTTDPATYSPGYTSEIWQVDRLGVTGALAKSEDSDASISQPTWSPDGTILYDVRETYFQQEGIAGRTTTIERRVLATGDRSIVIENALWPAVSPDGRLLAFVRFGVNGRADLWVRDLTSNTENRLTDSRFGNITSPRFSPDGREIAFGGAIFPLRTELSPRNDPSIGARLLALLVNSAQAHDLLASPWMVNLDGSKLRQVATLIFDGPLVRWVGDSSQLLVYEENGLFSVDVGTGQRTTVFQPGSYRGFDWLRLSPATSSGSAS